MHVKIPAFKLKLGFLLLRWTFTKINQKKNDVSQKWCLWYPISKHNVDIWLKVTFTWENKRNIWEKSRPSIEGKKYLPTVYVALYEKSTEWFPAKHVKISKMVDFCFWLRKRKYLNKSFRFFVYPNYKLTLFT